MRSHHDLTSFLSHAKTSQASTVSTVYTGTLFEYIVKETLDKVAILSRCGGANDRGIDLRGHLRWNEKAKVIVQCKAEVKKQGPRVVRELEGALIGESAETIGILASRSIFTEGARRQMLRSTSPIVMCLVHIAASTTTGSIAQFVWNSAAHEHLNNVQVQTQFHNGSDRLQLSLDGKII